MHRRKKPRARHRYLVCPRPTFEFRPNNIRFDLIYVVEGGGWRLHAISVAEMRADAPR